MIQRSDNTATDHLLFLLGREQIEKRMLLDGHHNPQLNTPLCLGKPCWLLK
ncbi:MAG: serine hydrolase [Candidatus Methanofishera endochildressiae]|uniref:Serine hydrolase n=1 Tax=Candidatus Methanofishera endochildressiae TaxID=2738884 RepID=A0A7Z0MPF1_9GAMM|nr:serine hydrolase [Candidatus Methanofishera endochildressiae]